MRRAHATQLAYRVAWTKFIPCLVFSFVALGLVSCASSAPKRKLSADERARMFVDVANGALLEGDPTAALENLARAEALAPRLPEIYHSRGLAFLMKKDGASALREVQRAVRLQPEYPEANNTLGKLFLDAGKYEEAEKHLAVAAENPLYREAYRALTALGILYYRKADFGRSRVYLDRAIGASPQLACIAYYYRGHLQLRESRFREAVRDYDQATRRLCASFGDAHLALGIAYVKGRQYDMARRKFLEVQERFPDSELADKAVSQLRYLP